MEALYLRILVFAAAVAGEHSTRVGRALAGGAARLFEIGLRLARRIGWRPAAPWVLTTALGSPPRVSPQYPSPGRLPARPSAVAEALASGVFRIDGGSAIPVQRLSWRRDPFPAGASAGRFFFHALQPASELLDAYRLTTERRYIEGAAQLAHRWIEECLYAERPEWIWDDHATALRALVLCRLWDALRRSDVARPGSFEPILQALARHGRRLAAPAFHRAGHNHGITQAYALLAIGLTVPALPDASTWADLGRARLETHLRSDVTAEGVHCEHSPHYQLEVIRQFAQALALGRAAGSSFSPDFVRRLEAMLASAAHMIKPDGTLPAFGDGWRHSPVCVGEPELDGLAPHVTATFRYAVSRGAEGQPPAERRVLFADGGYAFLRSGWGETGAPCDERWVGVRLATFPTAHVHYDLLSFELYGWGDDLICDSGGPDRYGGPTREFLRSTAAHSTVEVDGRSQSIGRARVLHWASENGLDILDAEHEASAGVRHRRLFVFVRGEYLVVIDRLQGRRVHRYTQRFHLAPALEPSVDGHGVTTRHHGDGPTVDIVPVLPVATARLRRGETRPRQGWVCTGLEMVSPRWVVEYEQDGTEATFATLLVPQRPGRRHSVQGTLSGTLFGARASIVISLGDRVDAIALDGEGRVQADRMRS